MLCIVIGRRWAHLALFGAMHCCWVVSGPYPSSLVGSLVVVALSLGLYSSSLVEPFIVRWVVVRAYSSSLECRWALVIFIGSHHCWVVLLFVIGSSFPHAGVIYMIMVGVGWSCHIWYASVGWNVGVKHSGQRQGRKKRITKMNYNFDCGSLSWCTKWSSHFFAPPPSCSSLPSSAVEHRWATHIPLERGEADVTGIRVPALAGSIVDRAHIPQERGGAPCGVVSCSWEGVEREMVVVRWGRTNQHQLWCSWCQIKTPLVPSKIAIDINPL